MHIAKRIGKIEIPIAGVAILKTGGVGHIMATSVAVAEMKPHRYLGCAYSMSTLLEVSLTGIRLSLGVIWCVVDALMQTPPFDDCGAAAQPTTLKEGVISRSVLEEDAGGAGERRCCMITVSS